MNSLAKMYAFIRLERNGLVLY